MSLSVALALAAVASPALPQCRWDRPGAHPFRGDVVAAVDGYADIPAAQRDKLKARLQAGQHDDMVVIDRDGIRGRTAYAPEIRELHVGDGIVCATVTRSTWAPEMQDRGEVYCEAGQCLLVLTAHGNVGRIRRLDTPARTASATQASGAAEDSTPLEFEPPGAGPAPADSFAGQSGVPSLGGAGRPGGLVSPPLLPGMGMPPLPPAAPPVNTLPVVTPAVPEPGTWAMVAAGLAIVGWRARRRRR